jgi:ATP-dependent RNA helicase DDX24/MAK5
VEKYIHRSGRTARASSQGLSVLLISPEESRMYRNILRLKEGEELSPFPVEAEVVEALKPAVKLATDVDKEEHRFVMMMTMMMTMMMMMMTTTM